MLSVVDYAVFIRMPLLDPACIAAFHPIFLDVHRSGTFFSRRSPTPLPAASVTYIFVVVYSNLIGIK